MRLCEVVYVMFGMSDMYYMDGRIIIIIIGKYSKRREVLFGRQVCIDASVILRSYCC